MSNILKGALITAIAILFFQWGQANSAEVGETWHGSLHFYSMNKVDIEKRNKMCQTAGWDYIPENGLCITSTGAYNLPCIPMNTSNGPMCFLFTFDIPFLRSMK